MTEKSFLQAFQTWQRTKRERPGVRGSHCVFFQASCASLRVGFFQCCWQWGEALWWLMLLRAPVWCNNCLSRCSPGLRCPVRRWTRPSQESLLSTAVRPLENKSEDTRTPFHKIKHTGKRGQLNETVNGNIFTLGYKEVWVERRSITTQTKNYSKKKTKKKETFAIANRNQPFQFLLFQN